MLSFILYFSLDLFCSLWLFIEPLWSAKRERPTDRQTDRKKDRQTERMDMQSIDPSTRWPASRYPIATTVELTHLAVCLLIILRAGGRFLNDRVLSRERKNESERVRERESMRENERESEREGEKPDHHKRKAD